MGALLVHEFSTLDGVIESPTWTFDYGFGSGNRLFLDGSGPLKLSLAAADSYANGAVHLAYKRG